MPSPDPEESDELRTMGKLLKERDDEILRKEEAIRMLRTEIEEKDALIKHLKNEIDKFRQVVRPITQRIITKQISLGDEPKDHLKKVAVEQRIKRQAISAEPVDSQSDEEFEITKIPKCQK